MSVTPFPATSPREPVRLGVVFAALATGIVAFAGGTAARHYVDRPAVARTPAVCVEALDYAAEGFTYAADAIDAAQRGATRAADEATRRLEALTDDAATANAACRAGAR